MEHTVPLMSFVIAASITDRRHRQLVQSAMGRAARGSQQRRRSGHFRQSFLRSYRGGAKRLQLGLAPRI